MNASNSILNIKKDPKIILRWLMVVFVFFVILNRAWMSDDAYITLRTVDNFINGYGLTWNVNERVEVYTHPLWMLLLSFFYFFTNEAYLTTIFISLTLTLFTLIYLQSKIKPLHHFILVFLTLGLSNAFVDFSTSGLENILNYVLFTLFFFQFFDKKEPKENYFKIVFLAGLIGMTRLDLLLMILPLLIYVFFQQTNKLQAIRVGLLAVSPLIAWEIFSFIYYGYMFPNTYYAKLNSGTPSSRLLLQGVFYIIASIQRDPLTPLVIFFGMVYGLFNRNLVIRLWSIGLVLYLAYIIKIGGDFMVGRFLTIPFLISLLMLSRTFINKLDIPKTIVTGIMVVVLGIVSPLPSFMQTHPDGYLQWFQGVSDEREMYFRTSGLFRDGKINTAPDSPWVDMGVLLNKKAERNGPQMIIHGANGFLGYYAGPGVYIIDDLSLGNAFFAHQPIQDFSDWRIGHFRRKVTWDYLQSLRSGKNVIQDEELARLYDEVVMKTKTN
jgi:arabinofuranosyltransferase